MRARLTAAVVTTALAWGLAVSALVALIVWHESGEIFDGALRESAQIIGPLLEQGPQPVPAQGVVVLPALPHEEPLIWQRVDGAGRVRQRSHAAPEMPLAAPQEGRSDVEVAGRRWHVLTLAPDAQGMRLHVAQPEPERRKARLEAAGIPALVSLLVGGLCAWWLGARVRREMGTLEALGAAVSRLDPEDAATRLQPPTRLELQPLQAAIADLAHRLQTRSTHARAFAGHAAHALRTPLAGIVAQLALASQRAAAIEAPHALLSTSIDAARQSARRLGRVVDALLLLFRGDGKAHRESTDLRALVGRLAQETPGLRVHLDVGANGDGWQREPWSAAEIDADLLYAALVNLLDNAVAAGAAQATIELAAGARHRDGDPPTLALTVHDDGPGVDAAQRALLSSALASQGYDAPVRLGLMLADLVARAHGGHAELPAIDRGFAVTLHLGMPDRAR